MISALPQPVDSELPAAVSIVDALTASASPTVGSILYVWNGTGFDRVRSVAQANGASADTGIVAAGLVGYDGTNYRRAKTDTSGNLIANLTPSGTGWSASSQTALTNTKVAVKASAGTFGGYMIYNPNAAVSYIQIFDVASASVTLGTTAPTYVLSIPASSAANLELTVGVAHATAITLAATTTPTGSTAPATTLTAAFFYK